VETSVISVVTGLLYTVVESDVLVESKVIEVYVG